MNKQTRSQLESIYDQIMEQIAALRAIGEAEQEKYDNSPENLQDSDRVLAYAECADAIESVCDDLESAAEQIQDDVLACY